MIFPMPNPKAVTLHNLLGTLGFAFRSGLMHSLSIVLIRGIVLFLPCDFVTDLYTIELALVRNVIRLLI